MNNSPLRYPGGKSRISKFVAKLIEENNIIKGHYVEPFAGGAGVALNLLFSGVVDNIFINDKDKSIYAFWYSILNDTDKFIDKIISLNVTIEEWLKQREIQKNENTDMFHLGFSTFFLNRTNRSGIIKGGVIGGIEQAGNWKLDVRFNKEALIKKIQRIAAYKEHIHIYNMDAIDFLNDEVIKLDIDNTLIYLDPPYYAKAKQLYMNFFEHKDHVKLYDVVNKLQYLWLVSYDNQKEIKEIYKNKPELTIEYDLRYTAGVKGSGREIMFASENLIFTKRNPITLEIVA
ncbi:MAG: DNA adenine methylase [Alphaproteobacteria bacterium]|nr:DNA adenine methylase [Alphaproteobacteria bacterium]